MQAAEATLGTRESVGAWVSQMSTLAQSVSGNATRRHEFMYSEPHHNTFRGITAQAMKV